MSSDAETSAIESVVRSRLSVVQDASVTVVSACAAWIGVYCSVAPSIITRVWASIMCDANSDTDQRVGLLAVLHESLKNCARRGGSNDVIRKFILSSRRDVPPAIDTALSLEPEDSDFRRASFQALSLWRNFSGFFPTQWLEKTIAQVASSSAVRDNMAINMNTSLLTSAMDSANGRLGNTNNNSDVVGSSLSSASSTSANAAVVDSLVAESSGLADVLRLFQKYSAAVERLRRYEADSTASASTIESVRDDVIHRAKPLLAKLGVSGGGEGFIPTIEAEVKRVSNQQVQQHNNQQQPNNNANNFNNHQQQQQTNEDAAVDPLEDFFA